MIDHCLITGAGSGIGQAIALRLAESQIPLLLVGRAASTEVTRQLVINRGGLAEVFVCDLEDSIKLQAELPNIIGGMGAENWGVVLAASILDPKGMNSVATDYEQVFRTNVVGNLAVLEACLPYMLTSHHGRVVFFAGGGAAYAYPMFPAYALSKVSTVRLVENLAATYPADTGCSFVCLAPGAVDTPMLARVQSAGGEVKTKTAIEEPVDFVERYLASNSGILSGRYVHVRDNWASCLAGTEAPTFEQFYLRRIQ